MPIAGIRGVVLEVLGDDRYKIGAAFTRAGVLHESEWVVEGWQAALAIDGPVGYVFR